MPPAMSHLLDIDEDMPTAIDPLRTEITERNNRRGSRNVPSLKSLLVNFRRSSAANHHDRSESDEDHLRISPTATLASTRSNSTLKYFRIHNIKKQKPDLSHIFLSQTLFPPLSPEDDAKTNDGAIWSAQFSPNGLFFAAAGKEGIIWIWQILTREHHIEKASEAAPIFPNKPIRIYTGHTDQIIDIKWSINNFLISASLDKTVRLWHVERPNCLAVFEQSDTVASVAFHPTDDRFFLTGSLDCKLNLWSIPDREIVYSRIMPDMVTAVAFSPRGVLALAGCYDSQLIVCETSKLKTFKGIHVGTLTKGAGSLKITGIEVFHVQGPSRNGDGTMEDIPKVLVTANCGRVRVYNLEDLSLDKKYKGLQNDFSQVSASLSSDRKQIICGSEDGRTYFWNVDELTAPGTSHDVLDCEYVHTNYSTVSMAVFAPQTTMKLIAASGWDPIYATAPRDIEDDSAGVPAHGRIFVTSDTKGGIRVFREDPGWESRRNRNKRFSSFYRKSIGYIGNL